jgi:hypothetical protein
LSFRLVKNRHFTNWVSGRPSSQLVKSPGFNN